MKKLYLIFLLLMMLRLNVLPQLNFIKNSSQQKMFTEQTTSTTSFNIDSLMLDSIIVAYKNSNSIPGIATLIIKNNEVIWSKNYGHRNLQLQLPVEDSTIFLIASVSKLVLATAVMQLWENGMIKLENNINDYLPSGISVKNPSYLNTPITVKMLMIHTSSIQDNWDIIESFETCGDSPMRLDSLLVKYLTPGGTYYNLSNYYAHPPGQQWHYSNVGASLLALMVEKLTGKTLYEYCEDSIFTPLSMNSTSWFLEGLDTNKIATPYEDSSPVCQQGWVLYPAAFLRTNKIDLSKFLLAYLNNGVNNSYRLLDSTTISYMLSDQLRYNAIHELPWWAVTQGLIWFNAFTISNFAWGHAGSWDGNLANICYDPYEKWGTLWFQNWRSSSREITRLGEINHHFTRYAHLYGNIYALRPSIDKFYARKNIDSVLFRTTFSNIYNHQFTSHLIYINTDSTQIDSLTLFDDGLHGDSFSNDGIFGGYIPPQQTENFFSLAVSTIDNLTEKYFSTPIEGRFITAGPVVIDSISVRKQFTNYAVRPFVHNAGTALTIPNASIKLICGDPWLKSSVQSIASLPDLMPGSSVGISTWISISYIDSLFPGYFNFKVEIRSDNFTYWTDSIRVDVITGVEDDLQQPLTFKLEQNYPNPFNPTTKIPFTIPYSDSPLLGGARGGSVILKVYDVLGNDIATLVNEEKEAGSYEVEFDAEKLTSGVYFYQLKANEFIQARKMILMK